MRSERMKNGGNDEESMTRPLRSKPSCRRMLAAAGVVVLRSAGRNQPDPPARCECPVLIAIFCSALSRPQAFSHCGFLPFGCLHLRSQALSQLTEPLRSQLSVENDSGFSFSVQKHDGRGKTIVVSSRLEVLNFHETAFM